MSPSKRVTLTTLALLLLGGCSADQLSVVVQSARAPGDKCDFKDDTIYVESGSVDMTSYNLGPGTTDQQLSSYGQIFGWQNNMQPIPLIVNGQTVDTGSGNDFIVDEAVMSYQYSDGSVTFPNEVQNLHAVINAGGTHEKNSVGLNLIGAGASAALLGHLPVVGNPQTLVTSFLFRGKTAAGRGLDTNVVRFPLTIYRSSAATVVCDPAAGVVPATGPCGIPGRDLTVHCVTST